MFVRQDLATHTRVTPAVRQVSLVKLSQALNRTPAARAELDKWGLMIDEKLMDVCIVFLLTNYFVLIKILVLTL